ncbi:MAG: TRAP transporter small permease subunit [Peptostreptococcaceae bacterium]|nr:TRAP transporter small permease subunit [Peptostreptococcaceae bacterium]
MNIVNKINNIIVRVEQLIIALSVLILSITLIASVLGRILFGKGIYAAEEIGQYCIYAITFIGLSYVVTTGKHINMLALFDMMPLKFRKIGALLISSITGITMGILTIISFQYVDTLKLMGKVSINLQVPVYLVVAVISCAFLFATFQYILIFIRNLQSEDVYLGLNEMYIPDIKKEAKDEC